MLLAIRRASSSVSTLYVKASWRFSLEQTYASDCPLASHTLNPPAIFSTVHGGGNLCPICPVISDSDKAKPGWERPGFANLVGSFTPKFGHGTTHQPLFVPGPWRSHNALGVCLRVVPACH